MESYDEVSFLAPRQLTSGGGGRFQHVALPLLDDVTKYSLDFFFELEAMYRGPLCDFFDCYLCPKHLLDLSDLPLKFQPQLVERGSLSVGVEDLLHYLSIVSEGILDDLGEPALFTEHLVESAPELGQG